MTYAEKLEIFADLATEELFEEVRYWDASDPYNRQVATDYFEEELTFLDGHDKEDLIRIWNRACDDARDFKLLLTAVKDLRDKYDTSQKN